jgi:HD-GYP domain-containing protein (c-di-GMP phosphodiesterase class II)
VYQHHEHLDGSGYPRGLKGDEIMLEARLLSVADFVEAVSSHRPYRVALGSEVAINDIHVSSGTYFDPVIVNACAELFESGEFAFPPQD